MCVYNVIPQRVHNTHCQFSPTIPKLKKKKIKKVDYNRPCSNFLCEYLLFYFRFLSVCYANLLMNYNQKTRRNTTQLIESSLSRHNVCFLTKDAVFAKTNQQSQIQAVVFANFSLTIKKKN